MKRITVLCSILLLLVPFTALAQDFCEGNFDYDKDQDGTDAFVFKSDFGRSTLLNPCPGGFAAVGKTGETNCWDTEGNSRDCAGTGEDGEYQKGVPWPNPRFIDHEDGTVTDNLTGLMWTRDAQQISGTMTWQAALDACSALDYAGHDDWRLPNLRELQSLIDYSQIGPALSAGHPFINELSEVTSLFWSSTTIIYEPGAAWLVNFYYGNVFSLYKSYTDQCYVRAVRGGH